LEPRWLLSAHLVEDINQIGGPSYPSNFTTVNGILYFTATDAEHGTELWKSDGTAEGTVLVADIFSGTATSSPRSLTEFNGTLVFVANDNDGSALWRTDGTRQGTVLIKRINVSTEGTLPVLNGKFYFAGNEPDTGCELWTSDGFCGFTHGFYFPPFLN
jgi:ELWxxDGT repeat protein